MPKDVAIYIVVVFKIIGQKPNKPRKIEGYIFMVILLAFPPFLRQTHLIKEH